MNRSIYIVLTQPKTVVAKILHAVSRQPFNHASISFCDDLDHMYSFGRKYMKIPVIGGFVEEGCDKGFFERFTYTSCAVYKISVSEEQYNECLKTLDQFKANSSKYKYNFIGLLTIPLHIPFSMENRFVCSHFVAYMLGQTRIVNFSKDVRLITPWDLAHIVGAKEIYQGNLRVYKQAMGVA